MGLPSVGDRQRYDPTADHSSKRAEQLLELVYDEPRRLASAKMARETPGQTLQPTALVHEAWLGAESLSQADSLQ
jgi:hypothetical protein